MNKTPKAVGYSILTLLASAGVHQLFTATVHKLLAKAGLPQCACGEKLD